MSETVGQLATKLLEQQQVDVILGYRRSEGTAAVPTLVTKAEQANELIFDETCGANLVIYLGRGEVKALGRIGVVLKACDARALTQLRSENQVDETVVTIGVRCAGVQGRDGTWAGKCISCETLEPAHVDHVVGPAGQRPAGDDPIARDLAALCANEQTERWAFWRRTLGRCLRCYACRAICPLCYCEQCICDKTEPRWIEASAHERGNMAFHIIRALHLAGRCVQCGECERACPMDIPLGLIARHLADEVSEAYGARAGSSPTQGPAMGSWREDDDESFIR